jgi:hypothetical protein
MSQTLSKRHELKIIPMDLSLVMPVDCIGKVFISNSNVCTIPTDLEDIIKSNSYFGAIPQELYIVADEPPKRGDTFITPSKSIHIFDDENYKFMSDEERNASKKVLIRAYDLDSDLFIKIFMENYNKGNIINSVVLDYQQEYVYKLNDDGEKIGFPEIKTNYKINLENTFKEYYSSKEVKNLWKRISSGEIIDLINPLYIDYDGIKGYLIQSNNNIYHFFDIGDGIQCHCVTQYFEKQNDGFNEDMFNNLIENFSDIDLLTASQLLNNLRIKRKDS